MAKTYSVSYGVQEIPLRCTIKERRELEKRYGMGLMTLIRRRVMPTDAENAGGGVFDDQVAFVHAGLKHAGPKITEKAIADWFEKLTVAPRTVDDKAALFEVIERSVRAAFASGILGVVFEEAGEDDEEEPEGKVLAGEQA